MSASRPVLLLVAAAAVLVAAGCSTRVREAEGSPDFADALAEHPVVALLPVTVAPDLDAVFAEDDQLDADEALYAAFLAAGPSLEPWPPATVQTLAGAEATAVAATQYTRLGRLRPDQVRALAGALDGCGFLAVGRLTEESVQTHAQNQTSSDPAARAEGLAEHGRPWTSIVSVEREVRVTLEIFDLESGDSVWRSEATSNSKQLYEYEDGLGEDAAQYIQQRIERANGPDHLSRGGEALKLPDLIDLLRQAFTGLVDHLPLPGS